MIFLENGGEKVFKWRSRSGMEEDAGDLKSSQMLASYVCRKDK